MANYANDSTDRLRENANEEGGGPKSRKFCERNKWMLPKPNRPRNRSKSCVSPTLCLNAQQNYIFQEAKLTCVSTKVYNTSEATDIGIFGAILEPEQ